MTSCNNNNNNNNNNNGWADGLIDSFIERWVYVQFLEIKFFAVGVDIRLYSMYDLSGELNVILIVIWWLQKVGKDWQ
jgi:hypothetical protein